MKVLIGVDSRLLRRRPAGRIHARRPPGRLIALHPLHEQRNRILGPSHAAQIFSRAPGRASRHFDGRVNGHHGRADVYVVRVQVVRDVALRASPGGEGLELGSGLAHVAVEVVEVAQLFGPGSSVGVGGVEALVVFDVDKDVVPAGLAEQLLVLGEELDGRFGDEDVDAALDCVESYGEVGGVWGEDCDGIAWGEGIDGGFVRVWVTGCGVGGE